MQYVESKSVINTGYFFIKKLERPKISGYYLYSSYIFLFLIVKYSHVTTYQPSSVR